MSDNRPGWRFSQGGTSAALLVLAGCAGNNNARGEDDRTSDGGESNGNEGNGMEPTDSTETPRTEIDSPSEEGISLWSGGEPVEDGDDYLSVEEAIEVSLTPQ